MTEFPQIKNISIEKKIGEGSIAEVFLGTDNRLGRKVAVKFLKREFQQPHLEARFEKESRIVANLNHPNIVTLYDTGYLIEGDTTKNYIIMEYLGDIALKDILEKSPGNRLEPESAFDMTIQLLSGLDCAHKSKIVHRDIKPANIMFREDGTPVLLDFGFAKVLDLTATTQTKSGTMIGTPCYMSPEQCRAAREIDGRSDIYSMGVILFEMLVGKRPYDGNNPIRIALSHIEEPIPKLPDELSQYQMLIEKMMAKDRENRLQNAKEFSGFLEVAESESSSSQTKTGIEWEKEAHEEVELPGDESNEIDSVDTSSEPIYQEKSFFSPGKVKFIAILLFLVVSAFVSWEVFLKQPGFRSAYILLSVNDAEAMLKEKNFFDSALNPNGNFANEFREKNLGKGDQIIIDEASNLVWYNGGISEKLTFKKAIQWIEDLNWKKYGGFNDWRLPTLEEAATLIEELKNPLSFHLPKVFHERIISIWTGDSLRSGRYWVILFNEGNTIMDSLENEHFVLPVRSSGSTKR